MLKKQEDKLNMYDSVLAHYQQNESITSTRPALQAAYVTFKNITAEINATVQQMGSIKGHAMNKTGKKKILSSNADELAGTLYAWAASNSDAVLKEKVKHRTVRCGICVMKNYSIHAVTCTQ